MINLTDIPRLARSLSRLIEITRTLAKYGLADTLARLDSRFVRRVTAFTGLAKLAEGSRETRIRLVLTELGTTFIKFGQVLSTRRDLVGPALGDELAQLQSHVPADPFEATRATIEAELGRPLEQLFKHFEPQPVASASIGQVHRAILPDGRKVAVKVQHPDIARRIEDDLAILHELAFLAEHYLPEFRPYRPVAVVAEFERVLWRELDFCRELRHLQLFRNTFKENPSIRFPEPHPHLSSRRVLTMEWFDGIPFSQAEAITAAGGNLGELARRGAKAFLDMIFRDGLFHADPHPGNVFYLRPCSQYPGGAIGLIDVGMVGRIDDQMRERIDRAVTAVLRKDSATVTELIVQVGDVPLRFDVAALECEVAEQIAFYHGMPLEQFQLGTALNELTEAIRRYHILLPTPLALLLRVLVMLEGTGRRLAPDFNLVELLEDYSRCGAWKRLSPRRTVYRLLSTLQDWDDVLRTLPRHVGHLLRRLQRQELVVQLSHRHLEPSVNRLVFGWIISALFVGSAMLWAAKAPPLWNDISIVGAVGFIISAISAYRLLRAIQHSGKLEDPDEAP
ncbi:MAG: AarF/ABC1/UbiB kinase family protein [Gemmataceae bacterium]|nr:AarF/ABC1/UbiB kinase family protein [Gemmata sp.]MDW8196888.1 AarF/ABC1/UbiB kinase family protein [Gemmataceae bacterium]